MENTTDKYIGKILDDRYEIIELIGSGECIQGSVPQIEQV